MLSGHTVVNDRFVQTSDRLLLLSSLLHSFHARPDVIEPLTGFTPLHCLMHDGIERGIGVVSWGSDGDGHSDETADKVPHVGLLTRYEPIESLLTQLVEAGKRWGYERRNCEAAKDEGEDIEADDGEDDEKNEAKRHWRANALAKQREQIGERLQIETKKASLLDAQDAHGNTALHWCVHYRRVDLVAMLLLHGARIDIKNHAGTKVYDMVQWQTKEEKEGMNEQNEDDASHSSKASSGKKTTSTSKKGLPKTASSSSHPSSIHPHPLLASFDSSVYATPSSDVNARKWGLPEGMRIEHPSYEGESEEAAIKRLIFSQALFDAVDAGDNGNLDAVKRLVKEWLDAERSGRFKMYPLMYRADHAYNHPLHVAVSYEDDNVAILYELLKLPFAFHVQSAATNYPPLHAAAMNNNEAAVRALIDAGCNVNFRDVVTGKTPFLCLIADVCPIIEQDDDDGDDGDDASALVAAEYRTQSNIFQMMNLLTMNGSDLYARDDDGNNALHHIAHTGWKFKLLQTIRQKMKQHNRATEMANMQNQYGCTHMHFALAQPFNRPSHLKILRTLFNAGGTITEPRSIAGMTPLQCLAPNTPQQTLIEIADTVRMDVEELKRGMKHPREREIDGRSSFVVCTDICAGRESSPIPMLSGGFVVTEHDMPIFRYRTHLQPSDATRTFCETWNTMAKMTEEYARERERSSRTPTEGWNERRVESVSLQQRLFGIEHLAPERKTIEPHMIDIRMTEWKGWGLFARTPIPANFALPIIGEVVTLSEIEHREVEYIKHQRIYLNDEMRLKDPLQVQDYAIDLCNFANVSRFLNHSCEPNMKLWLQPHGRRLMAYTKRAIKADEELCIDYMLTHMESKPRSVTLCHCGSKHCRRFIM